MSLCDVPPVAAPWPPAGSPDRTDFERDLDLAAQGDEAARNRLWSVHFEQLKQIVVQWFERNGGNQRQRGDLSIGPTHIVGELYLKLGQRDEVFGRGRDWLFRCFYNECSRIFLDHLRKRRRHHAGRVPVDGEMPLTAKAEANLEVLSDLLARLAKNNRLDADIAAMKILESVPDEKHPGAMRKLHNAEVAKRLGCSLRLVEQRWAFLKGYLQSQVQR
jgi:DNA-directed RNA polymerase specialized sigma24 family protein